MESSVITALSNRIRRSPATWALLVLARAGAAGCAAGTPDQAIDDGAHTDAEIASAEAALIRGGGSGGLGFTCTNGSCECDKSIENDCEDMSGVCSDDTVDDLITCINGWLTTHCTCRLARVAPRPTFQVAQPIGSLTTLYAR